MASPRLRADGLAEPQFTRSEGADARPEERHHAHQPPVRLDGHRHERAPHRREPLDLEKARVLFDVGHVDGALILGDRAGDALARLEARAARRVRLFGADGLHHELAGVFVEEQERALGHREPLAHLLAELLELLGQVEGARERRRDLQQELDLAQVRGQLFVGALELAAQADLALHLVERLLRLDLVHRHVGDLGEHRVEAARQFAELVVALDARAHEELAALGAGHRALQPADGPVQEARGRERDGQAGEEQREAGAHQRAAAQFGERPRRIGRRQPLRVVDEQPHAREQHRGRRDGRRGDELCGERAANALQHSRASVTSRRASVGGDRSGARGGGRGVGRGDPRRGPAR